MIIEAGWDIRDLMFDGGFAGDSLRVISLDADFRVVARNEVAGAFDGDLAKVSLERLDDAVPQHDEDDEFARRYAVRFVALGYEVPRIDGAIEHLDWERYGVIKDWFGCRGIDVLGVYVSSGEYWASSGPMKTFSTYLGADDYPRIQIIRAPHPFLTCDCAVCGPERERIERARATADENGGV